MDNKESFGIEIKAIVSEFNKKINKVKENIMQIYDITKDRIEFGANFNKGEVEKQISSISNEIEKYQNTIKEFDLKKKQWAELPKSQKTYTKEQQVFGEKGFLTARDEAEKAETKIVELQAELKKLQQDLNAFKSDNISKFGNVISNIKEKSKGMGETLKNLFVNAGHGAKQLFTSIKDGFKNGISKVKDFANNIKNKLSKAFDNTKKVTGKFNKNVTNTFGKGIKSLKRFTLGLIGIRTATSVLTKAYGALMGMDNELSKSFQNSWRMLGSILAPVIEKLAVLFNYCTTAVVKFVQALTGINLVARANTKALKNQNKQLASFDELSNLSSPDDNQIKMGDIDTTGIDNLVDKIKSGQWYELGFSIGEKISQGFSSINWDGIKTTIVDVMANTTSAINGFINGFDWANFGTTIGNSFMTIETIIKGFFEGINWSELGNQFATTINNIFTNINFEEIGSTLANGLKSIFNFFYNFVTNTDWKNIGSSISNTINSFFANIEWGKSAQQISQGIRNLFDGLKEAVRTLNWEQLGNDIWEYVSNIDWAGIVEDLAYLLGGLITGIGKFIWGFIETAVDEVTSFWSTKFEENGGNIIAGLFDGIDTALRGIGSWIIDHIFTPFINGFKDVFGIHSPSTVMAEMGHYIIDGLKNGVSGVWDNIKTFFTGIPDKVKGAISKIPDKFNEVLSGVPKKISGALSSISSTVEGTLNNCISGVNSFATKISSSNIGNAISGVTNAVWSKISSIKIPGFDVGTNYVPADMLAVVHKGEQVVPKKYNPNAGGQSGSDEETKKLLEQLIDAVNNIEINPYTTVKDIGKASMEYQTRLNRMTGGRV